MSTETTPEMIRLSDIPVPVAIVDTHSDIAWCNSPLTDLVGENPIGRPLLDLVSPESVEHAQHVLNTGETRTIALRAAGVGDVVVELSSTRLHDGDGWVVFAQRSRVELEILDELALKANELLGQGVIIGDATKCLHVNEAAADIFGRPVEELLSIESIFQLFEESERLRITDLVASLAAAGEPIPENYESVIVRPDGSHLAVDVSIKAAVRGGTTRTFTIVTDATERRAKQAKLAHQALHDPLTGLANRYLLIERLEMMLHRLDRESVAGTLMFLDLDQFKRVNDQWGHGAGDDVLRAVANRLQASIRSIDTAARLGGDEFVVLIGLPQGREASTVVAERLRHAISEPIEGDGWTAQVGVSVGILNFDDATLSAQELLAQADQAMYAEKGSGVSSP